MAAKVPFSYNAAELFNWIAGRPDFILLDVRNEKEFANWYVEGPQIFPYINIPYYNFMENLEESIGLIPAGEKIRIVCAQEGSAKYVAEQLLNHGFDDVGYLEGGIVSWGNALIPKQVSSINSKYELFQMIRPGKGACSYVLVSGNEAMVFDPSRNIDFYVDFVAGKGAKIIAIFETHRQADYISGSIGLGAKTGATIYVKKEDFLGGDFDFTILEDGQIFKFSKGIPEVKAIHTPGHTMGSTSYLVDNRFLISGDTVFIMSAGRPDLGGKCSEWSRYLYLTLTLKLRTLNDDVFVLPGHYATWEEANEDGLFMESMGNLRRKNIAFHLPTELAFAQFIEDHLRPQPPIYTEIRKVNAGWLKVDDQEANTMDLGKNECAASHYGKVGVSAESNRACET